AKCTTELQRLAPVAAARAEAAWLRGDLRTAADEVREALAISDRLGETLERHELEVWMWRAGEGGNVAPARHAAGDSADPYEEALALNDSDDVELLRRAVTILEQLGDGCLIHIVRQKLRARGARGPRLSTRANL